ncbi:MAG: hypothetical protein N2C12_01130, partial [Planctomycetales bacterium]
ALVIAQESDQTHPFLSDRFQLAIGAFAKQQGFKIAANGTVPKKKSTLTRPLASMTMAPVPP